MGLFGPSAGEMARYERIREKEKELKEKQEAKQKEFEERNAMMRTKSMKEQFLILSKRKDFWVSIFIIIVCIFLFIAKLWIF